MSISPSNNINNPYSANHLNNMAMQMLYNINQPKKSNTPKSRLPNSQSTPQTPNSRFNLPKSPNSASHRPSNTIPLIKSHLENVNYLQNRRSFIDTTKSQITSIKETPAQVIYENQTPPQTTTTLNHRSEEPPIQQHEEKKMETVIKVEKVAQNQINPSQQKEKEAALVKRAFISKIADSLCCRACCNNKVSPE